jgi:hypothetical protein
MTLQEVGEKKSFIKEINLIKMGYKWQNTMFDEVNY